MAAKSPNPHDRAIGQRIKARRMMINMSQETLGKALGLTFQQVQKYEKGVNRIGGGRMGDIARILGVTVTFLHGEDGKGKLDPAINQLTESIMDGATARLMLAASRLPNAKDRNLLADLAERWAALHK